MQNSKTCQNEDSPLNSCVTLIVVGVSATLCNNFGLYSLGIAKELVHFLQKWEGLLDFSFVLDTCMCCCLQTDTCNQFNKQFTAQILLVLFHLMVKVWSCW